VNLYSAIVTKSLMRRAR